MAQYEKSAIDLATVQRCVSTPESSYEIRS